MRPPASIAPDLTVRQAAGGWEVCARLLERFPAARWDGRWTLQELVPFARANGLDENGFLQQLAVAAGVPVARRAKAAADPSPVPLIFAAIVICLTLGAGWGVTLLLEIAWGISYGTVSGAGVHVHGVAQLWGWMALFIFAVGTHLLRQNTKRPPPAWLERTSAISIFVALVAFFGGLAGGVHQALPQIDVIASALLMLAAALFGLSVIWSLWGRGQKPQPWHRFVLASVAWLWVWTVADLFIRLRSMNLPVPPDAARNLLIVLPVLGFATNAIYGFGIRLIPGFLNITHLRPRFFTTALLLHNIGLCLLLTGSPPLHISGAALMLGGTISWLIGQNGLRGKASRPIYGVDPRGHILIRIPFFWLIFGLCLILIQPLLPHPPHAYSGAWRHALTVGFITTLILGVGQRLVPIFIKQPLASTRLLLIGAALIILGNAGRVGLELATIGQWAWAFRAMGVTGLLELSAIILFGLNLALTVRDHTHTYRAGERLTARTRLREAVNERPQLQPHLHDMGITTFDDSPFIAPSLTLGALALSCGRQPADLLAELEKEDPSPPSRPPLAAAGKSNSALQ